MLAAPAPPSNPSAEKLKILGNSLCSQRKFSEAIAAYDSALALDPSNVPVRSNKAAALLELGRVDEAIEVCKEALKIDAQSTAQRAKVHQRMATAFLKAGDKKKGRNSSHQRVLRYWLKCN